MTPGYRASTIVNPISHTCSAYAVYYERREAARLAAIANNSGEIRKDDRENQKECLGFQESSREDESHDW